MLVTGPVFTKHMVRQVPAQDPVPVQLLIGDRQQRVDVSRPMHFTEMTLLSSQTCSRRIHDLEGSGPRAAARRLVSRWGRPIDVPLFFDTRHGEPNNMSHLLMDILPLCLSVRKAVGEVSFIFRPLEPRFRELLSHFRIDPLCTYRPVVGTRFSFRLARDLAQFEVGHSFDAPVYSYTGEVYSDYIRKEAGPAKIFLSRRGPRSPINVDEVNEFLQDRDFRIIYLEDHCIAEQIALVQAADHIVAIHGAAVAYLALKDRTRTFVELMPPNVYHDHFPVGIGRKVDNFFQLMPSFDDDVQFQGWPAIYAHKQQPFRISLTQLAQVLDQLDC